MRRSRFGADQIISVLKEHEAAMKTADVCCKYEISAATISTSKACSTVRDGVKRVFDDQGDHRHPRARFATA